MMNGKQFRDALDRLNLTQTEAADLLGIDPRVVRRATGDQAVSRCVAIWRDEAQQLETLIRAYEQQSATTLPTSLAI